MVHIAVRLYGAAYVVAGLVIAWLGQFAIPGFVNGFGTIVGTLLGGAIALVVAVVGIAVSLEGVAFVIEDAVAER